MEQQNECLAITIQGVVQGVGFRPFVYNLARELGIRGFVSNTSEGVIIRAEGPGLDLFIDRIRQEAPPLSRIEQVEIAPSEPCGCAEFSIRESRNGGSFTLLSPDIRAKGLLLFLFRCLSSATDSRFMASQAMWKPPSPLTATIRPCFRSFAACPTGSAQSTLLPYVSSRLTFGPQIGQAFGCAWNLLSAGSLYSDEQASQRSKTCMVVF